VPEIPVEGMFKMLYHVPHPLVLLDIYQGVPSSKLQGLSLYTIRFSSGLETWKSPFTATNFHRQEHLHRTQFDEGGGRVHRSGSGRVRWCRCHDGRPRRWVIIGYFVLVSSISCLAVFSFMSVPMSRRLHHPYTLRENGTGTG
jgi:hypothetical protein